MTTSPLPEYAAVQAHRVADTVAQNLNAGAAVGEQAWQRIADATQAIGNAARPAARSAGESAAAAAQAAIESAKTEVEGIQGVIAQYCDRYLSYAKDEPLKAMAMAAAAGAGLALLAGALARVGKSE